jgi:protein SCO1/2
MSSVAQPNFRKGLLGALIATIVIVILAFGYQSWKSAQQTGSKVFDRFNTIPDFSFVDQSGQTITKETLKGKVWIADFFFTRCPGPCPIMSGRFAELDRNFSKGNSLALISFTVDPEFDTSAVLSRYGQRFEASNRWHFLTGEKPKIYDLAINGFQLGVQDPGSVMPNFIHSTKFALVDTEGVIRGYYDGTSEEVVQKLLLDIGSLLRHGGR